MEVVRCSKLTLSHAVATAAAGSKQLPLWGPGRGNRVLVGFEGWLPAACWQVPSGGQVLSGASLQQGRQAGLDGCKARPLRVVVLQAGVDKLLRQWPGRSSSGNQLAYNLSCLVDSMGRHGKVAGAGCALLLQQWAAGAGVHGKVAGAGCALLLQQWAAGAGVPEC